VKRIALTTVMLLMGTILIAGGAASIYPTALLPLDETIGTQSSVSAIALGIGICASAGRPAKHLGWVRIAILYGPLVIAYQVAMFFLIGKAFSFGPLIFGLACSLLVAVLYPQRDKLMPPTIEAEAEPVAAGAQA
jgi:hypothetical protein